jgi:uncharacterized protein
MGAYFALIFILEWAKITIYPPDSYNILGNLINCLFTSIREEFLFRFFLMSALAYGIAFISSKKVSIQLSLIITSVLFGLSHFFIIQERTFSWSPFLLDVTAGLVLGFAYLLTKSLYFSLGFHFGWNFFLGAIPVVSHISTHNAPEWDNLLTIFIVLIIMTSVYFFGNDILRKCK